MAEHQVELGGGVAHGLQDAAVAVVALVARGDGQGELVVEFDGLGDGVPRLGLETGQSLAPAMVAPALCGERAGYWKR